MDMHTQQEKASILLIYTGGTIGMIENPETGVLESFNFQHLKDNMPGVEETGVFGGHDTVRILRWTPRRWGRSSWMKT